MKRTDRLRPRYVSCWTAQKGRHRNSHADETIFLRQGDLDGACGFYCLLMALIGLGLFRRGQVLESEPLKRHSPLARIKANARSYYFSGMGTVTLTKLLAPLKNALDISMTNGADEQAKNFVLDHLGRGHLVIVGMQSFREQLAHWALAVGVGGSSARQPSRILLVDPDVERPRETTGNSVIDVAPHIARGRLRRVSEIDGKQWLARLDGAVAIGLKHTKARAALRRHMQPNAPPN